MAVSPPLGCPQNNANISSYDIQLKAVRHGPFQLLHDAEQDLT